VESVDHISDDNLERYAVRTLQVPACAALEEHLLIGILEWDKYLASSATAVAMQWRFRVALTLE
jgi:hypothetical protein